MKIEGVYNIKGRTGVMLACAPLTRPDPGNVLRASDGQAWLVCGVERFCVSWVAGAKVGIRVIPREGERAPVEGEEVEMIEPLDLLARLAEAEHNVRTLRAECARLGVEAADAKWSLTP